MAFFCPDHILSALISSARPGSTSRLSSLWQMRCSNFGPALHSTPGTTSSNSTPSSMMAYPPSFLFSCFTHAEALLQICLARQDVETAAYNLSTLDSCRESFSLITLWYLTDCRSHYQGIAPSDHHTKAFIFEPLHSLSIRLYLLLYLNFNRPLVSAKQPEYHSSTDCSFDIITVSTSSNTRHTPASHSPISS